MSAKLAVIPQDVARSRIVKASYGLAVNLSQSQRLALEETSPDRNLPAGRCWRGSYRSRTVEGGISRFCRAGITWRPTAGRRTPPTVNVSLIEASDADGCTCDRQCL